MSLKHSVSRLNPLNLKPLARLRLSHACLLALAALTSACDDQSQPQAAAAAPVVAKEYYGTLEPFAAEAVYFVVTDRFVNGDEGNDQREQGGLIPTFDRPLPECDGVVANVGYLGGDFKGLLDNASYISEMGFGAVWITPIVANPDQAFSGGSEISCTSILTDHGKTGYHGYWGTNFFQVDEHWESPDLSFAQLTQGLQAQGLKTVLDIVGNHGSPGWGMVAEQAQDPHNQFGKIYAANGLLLADHQNLEPSRLDPAEPLHAWFNRKPDLAELSDLNADNPRVLDYLVDAYSQWIDQGAAAFRIDTIAFQPHSFWHEFTQRIRARHPGFFMFAEAFNSDAAAIAPHTWPENAGVSVLDFPLRDKLSQLFGAENAGFQNIEGVLHLDDGLYQNPYELATFYDNHDMARLNASDGGFIDAHNWLFTARGIPVIYYGSEMGFMRGRAEHAGNRNYFGHEGIEAARQSPIRKALIHVAQLRQKSPALQRGLQLNLQMAGDRAAFYRVYQHDGVNQTALVLLNKSDRPQEFQLSDVPQGEWQVAWSGTKVNITGSGLRALVAAHGIQVFFYNQPLSDPGMNMALSNLMEKRQRQ